MAATAYKRGWHVGVLNMRCFISAYVLPMRSPVLTYSVLGSASSCCCVVPAVSGAEYQYLILSISINYALGVRSPVLTESNMLPGVVETLRSRAPASSRRETALPTM
eukprot:2883127-Rhodomonas_salina.2